MKCALIMSYRQHTAPDSPRLHPSPAAPLVEHGEEHHLDWIETQLTMIQDIGIERYLQANIQTEGSD